MGVVTLRFHGDLHDLAERSTVGFDLAPSIKDAIEAAGVPHPEVDLVLQDGEPVTLGTAARDGSTLDVYPRGLGPQAPRLLPGLDAAPRFVLDGHLGRLAAWLRLLGFDTLWDRDAADDALAATSAREDRVLLTRDVGLLKRSVVRRGAWVRSTHPPTQLREVVRRFGLERWAQPWTRCLRCNGKLHAISAETAVAEVPPRVRERQTTFFRCDGCQRLYWPGSHHDRLEAIVTHALAQAP